MKTIGGSTFVWNGVKQDYCFIETLNCLYDLCDEISIVYGGDDGIISVTKMGFSDNWNYYWCRHLMVVDEFLTTG